MKFVKSLNPMAVATAVISATSPSTLNINDASSVKSVAKTIASGTMSYYQGNAQQFVDLPKPHYWWQAGALMGTMLDYSHYTGDTSYDQVVATALLAQVGPNFDFMLPAHYGDEGNDDQAFWGFAVMAAAERNFPQPNTNVPSWLQLGTNLWNSLASRWNTTACDGGLLWQIFASNPNGLDYKNSVSNGGFFQISARLARATGNATYLEWAEKVWDWTQGVGMIDTSYNVHDGASASHNCTDTNPVTFSYSAGIYIYGAAVLANHTGDAKWAQRAEQLLQASRSFFSPFPNATDIMYEHACEQVGSCNTDMRSFKAYFSRFVYAASVFVPALQSTINELWHPSALAAAKSCSGGGAGGTACGQRWYAGGFDGVTGLGEQQCALETVQGLLVGQAAPPLRGGDIKTVRTFAASSTASKRGRYDARAV